MIRRYLLLLCGVCGYAANISVLGPPNPPVLGQGFALGPAVMSTSWIAFGAYQNVSISAWIGSNGPASVTASLSAFLMTQIGPGTTVAHEIASAVIPITVNDTAWTFVDLFSGLSLPANTYYLVLHDPGGQTQWGACFALDGCTRDLAADVSEGISYQAFLPGGVTYYPEATPTSLFSPVLLSHSITGDAVGEVPEPSSVLLTATALTALLSKVRPTASSRARS